MHLIAVVGARPNFIKLAPVVPALAAAGHDVRIAHTGQHYDALMSDVFFTDLEIPEPQWWLGVGSGTHAVQTATAMMRLEELLMAERPDALLVIGDVNSTLAGALAAAKVHVPVVHLEAGVRSFDMSMPEEVNRLVTDQLSAMHLVPTREAIDNLIVENVAETRIRFVGNVVAESVLVHAPAARDRAVCRTFGLTEGRYLLATVHRPENTDHPERLAAIVEALSAAPLPVLFPAHPRTRPLLGVAGAGAASSSLRVTEPVGYLDMLSLQADAAAVVTDSGGVQQEACVLGVPCVTVRRNTEWGITVELGANRLVPAEASAIQAAIEEALSAPWEWSLPERWDANVSQRVAEALSRGIVPPNGWEG